ncbi:hypothetical protein VTI74DRAFT_9537 [Chaetomium olivicolor]
MFQFLSVVEDIQHLAAIVGNFSSLRPQPRSACASSPKCSPSTGTYTDLHTNQKSPALTAQRRQPDEHPARSGIAPAEYPALKPECSASLKIKVESVEPAVRKSIEGGGGRECNQAEAEQVPVQEPEPKRRPWAPQVGRSS